MSLPTKKSGQEGSSTGYEDPIGRAQMVWSLLVALTVGFVLFQKNSQGPTQEIWTIQSQDLEKTQNSAPLNPSLK